TFAFLWSRRGADDSASSDRTRVASGSAFGPHRGVVAANDLLRWLGQRGVGARTVAGKVLRDDAPVAGVTVRLSSIASSAGVIAEPHVTTDAAGRFDFGPQLAMEY